MSSSRFSLATLFWLTLVAGISITAVLINRQLVDERVEHAERLELARQEKEEAVAEVIAGMTDSLERAHGTAAYFKRELGHFDNALDGGQFAAKNFRLPRDFGGEMSHAPPFHWYWRIRIPDPKQFELRFAISKIPQNGFDLPEASIHRMVLNPDDPDFDGFGGSFDTKSLDMNRPAEIVMFATMDQDSEDGSLHVRWDINQNFESFRPLSLGSRSKRIKIPKSELEWMNGIGVRQSYGDLSGFGAPKVQIARQERFDIKQPHELIRFRARRKIDQHNYEDEDDPTSGLLIWITKRVDSEKAGSTNSALNSDD